MVGCSIKLKNKTDWLSTLLRSKFFESCLEHEEFRKNDKNVFCIDCNCCFCKHCINSSVHRLHRRLQICRYVYHDVVRLQEIQKYLDCSMIQSYKINGEKAVHLNPRPQSKDSKSSKTKNGAICEACGRHIQDFPNKFCSIACKASITLAMSKEQRHNLIQLPHCAEFDKLHSKENYGVQENTSKNESTIFVAESSEEFRAWLNLTIKPKKQVHKRKGIPRRAPFH